MRQIWIPKAGPPEVLELREARDPLPGPGEVRIRVEAAGVNFADVLARMGMYPDLPRMPVVVGYEVAGRVDTVGADVGIDWKGRDVLALCRLGGYADVVCVPETYVFSRPQGMDAAEGAALPVNYLTAYQLLVAMGGLAKGDTVLIHSAGGGVGIAALQIARALGASTIGIASAHKHDALKSLGLDHAIDGRSEDFEARVRYLTEGRGVELAIDPRGGSSYRKSYRCLAPTGRLGMFGVSSAATRKTRRRLSLLRTLASTPWLRFHPFSLMNDNKGVFGVNLGRMWGATEKIDAWMGALLELYRDGAVRPVVAETFPFERAAEAHHYLQDRRNTGKVLLRP